MGRRGKRREREAQQDTPGSEDDGCVSLLLQGQTDPAMIGKIEGIAKGLRDRYGTIDPGS